MFDHYHRSRQKDRVAPQYRYAAVFEPIEEGGYTVIVPGLPGLVTEGAIVEEAIRAYLLDVPLPLSYT